MRIKISLCATSNVSYHPSKVIIIDDDEWADMDNDQRADYMDQEVQQMINNDIEGGWEVME